MAFDYCTAYEVFALGNDAGNSIDPVNQAGVMEEQIIPAVSRAIDRYCGLFFSAETYTNYVLRGVVDKDGVLTAYPPVPTMTDPTAEYRAGNSASWLSISGATVDVEEKPHGCVVRWLGFDLSLIRFSRIQVRASFTGGYADINALPDDLRLACQGICWYEFKRREAVQDRTAIPELGMVIIPGQWPSNYRKMLDHFRKVVAS
jgi:hypothetical protein